MNAGRNWPVARETPKTARTAGDSWDGLSRDVIERFIDVTSFSRPLSRRERRGYRADLVALDLWMRSTFRRTLVSSTSTELRDYFDERVAVGVESRLLQRLLDSLHDFYRHLSESGCRSDNPARRLPTTSASSATSGVVRHFR